MLSLQIQPKIDELRSLSRLLSNSSFKKIIKDGNKTQYQRSIKRHAHLFENYHEKTNGHILSKIYQVLSENYRNEYVYKSALVNQVLLREYHMNSTLALFEFKIGRSIADMLLINGKARVFEIKTELDSPERLRSQISDYRKSVANITVITDVGLADKYLHLLKGTKVGLKVLNAQNQIEDIKDSIDDSNGFEHEVLFKMLHKAEYTAIVTEFFGRTPDVPNTQYFSESLSLVKQIEINTFQRLVFDELKKRKIKETKLIESSLIPEELKAICIALNFSHQEIQSLFKFLGSPFSK